MSIQIDVVRISNFRGISNMEISLSKTTILLGQNNVGKTSVIKSLQLVLGDYSRYLSDEDFHISKDEKRQDKITIDLRIVPLDKDARAKVFPEKWARDFEDMIRATADESQFVAIRTVVKPDQTKGGFTIDRYYLDEWPSMEEWLGSRPSYRNKVKKRQESIPFISIESQRDIHSELKEKTSYVGRVLSSVKYDPQDVTELEKMIAGMNKEAVEKSEHLKQLKNHLDGLNQSFDGLGKTELTPFPKKIRDLSKRFSVHFGESDHSSFSMEYHGMGTRSWASMLTLKAFAEMQSINYESEAMPYFPIMAAEEPEAHLHPNAQRTLYKQLISTPGQMIISTHSPYIAGLANLHEIRFLKKINDEVEVCQIRTAFDSRDDLRKLQREIVHSRGELLFSRALVLSEGETEEQTLPALFEAYIGSPPFALGINFVGVGGSGAKYLPYLILAKDLKIPVYIFSDGEPKIIRGLKANYEKIFGKDSYKNAQNITVLEGYDFESYLFEQGFGPQMEQVIKELESGKNPDQDPVANWMSKKEGTHSPREKSNKPKCKTCEQPIYESRVRTYKDDQGRKLAILEIIKDSKPEYAKAIAAKLIQLPKKDLPAKILELFNNIKRGLGI
ncbi:MAG: AAA family ATPase [Candidatus Cloacimonetes bacterium]|nr:AAA family ATPase [Candidatus Cloacimonadota bacterium]